MAPAQWLAESSRNHHYQTSINTFLRKYVVGLDMPVGVSGWAVVKARLEAVFVWDDLSREVPGASVSIHSHRGVVAISRLWDENHCCTRQK